MRGKKISNINIKSQSSKLMFSTDYLQKQCK